MIKRLPTALTWGAAVVWLLATAGGMSLIWEYSAVAGAPAEAQSDWPSDSRLPGPSDRPILVMTLHPQCSCSQASLTELEQLMAGRANRMSVMILLSRPAGAPSDWTDTSLAKRAAAIPGVRVFVDDANIEALRFGANTSGQTLLFDARGHQVFAGGITSARGHEGDNAGLDIIAALVDGKPVTQSVITASTSAAELTTPVFGCSLFSGGKQKSP